MANPLRSFRARLALLTAAALGIRVLFTLTVGWRDNPRVPGGDRFFFHTVANLVADGQGFITPYLWVTQHASFPTAAHPPLWPLMLAGVSKLGGTTMMAHRLTGAVVGAALVAVIGALAARLAGPRTGLVAAGLAAVYPVLLMADGSAMSESLYALCAAASVLAAHRLLERPSAARAAALGVALGMAALTRTEGLLLLLFVALALAVLMPRQARAPVIAAVSVALLVIAPWIARDWVAFSRPVPISTNGAAVIGGANCAETYHGRNTGLWSAACTFREVGSAPSLASYNEADLASSERRAGLRYMRHHLPRLAPVAIIRVLRTWDLWQPARQARLLDGQNRRLAWLRLSSYYVVLGLALLGLLRWRRGPGLALVALPLLAATLASAAGWGFPRFRAVAEPSLVIMAAVALSGMRPGWAQNTKRPPRVRAR